MTDETRCDVLLIEDLGQQRLPARSMAAVVRQAGLSAQVAHFGAGDEAQPLLALARRPQGAQPRLVVLSMLFAHRVADNLWLAGRLRDGGVTAHLTMAGPLPSMVYAELLAACPALDSVLRGEAEAVLPHLAASLRDGGDWQTTPGLAYRLPAHPPKATGVQAFPRRGTLWVACQPAYHSPAVHTNPLPPPIDLDALPFPDRDEGIPDWRGYGFATVEGSRGCYHACAFCLPCACYRAGPGPAYRLRSVPHLAAEIEALVRRGARLFLFDDEQFLPPAGRRQERVAELAAQLRRRGLDIAFTVKCRADDVEEELFRQLKAMGLVRVYVGIESGCQASLDALGKGLSVECNARALAVLDELGILADFRCLLFHPWSTLDTIAADLEFLERALPHTATPFTFHDVECYPGTPLAARLADPKGLENPSGLSSLPSLDRDFRLAYTIRSPRAELLRRLGRLVFGTRQAQGGVVGRIGGEWYDVLLQRRFGPQDGARDRAAALRALVARLNREALAVWRDMLAFAAQGDIYDARLVNERAAAWAGRINELDMSFISNNTEVIPC